MSRSRIVTHINVDLDAITCVVMASMKRKEDPEVIFLPSGAPPEALEGLGEVRVLDHPLGEKGGLEKDGRRRAAVLSMPEISQADPNLLVEVDEQDSTGKVERPRFSLARILAGVRAYHSARGARGQDLDYKVLISMRPVIEGLCILYQEEREARKIAAEVTKAQIGPWTFAILEGETSPQVGIALNEMGVVGAVYSQGYNLGVTRYPGREEPDLRLLEPHLPGWFVHSAGFLACWGSRKSPAQGPPPEGTPQNAEELISLMREVIE